MTDKKPGDNVQVYRNNKYDNMDPKLLKDTKMQYITDIKSIIAIGKLSFSSVFIIIYYRLLVIVLQTDCIHPFQKIWICIMLNIPFLLCTSVESVSSLWCFTLFIISSLYLDIPDFLLINLHENAFLTKSLALKQMHFILIYLCKLKHRFCK